MLRYDDNTESAAQVRVTPQELAAAIARLEARQGENEGTIPLGDAVQELGLNATPEELLREIEAGRARQHESLRRTQPLLFSKLRLFVVSALASVLFGIMVGFFHSPSSSRTVGTIPVSPAAPQAAPIGIPDRLLVRQHDGKMVLLSEVSDGQPVFCELAATETGAKLADFAPSASHWTIIKHRGKVYVRGWIGDMSEAALRSTVVTVHTLAHYVTSGIRPVPVTLPLDGFQSPPGLTSDNMISATHVTPDEHLKEKW